MAQVPIAPIGLFVAIVLLPDTEREEPAPFDLAGTLLLAPAVGGALVGLNQGPEMGWTSPLVVAGFAAATLITDAALPHVAKLAQLERLNLGETVVTREGIEALQGLEHLRSVNLAGTRAAE